MTERGDRAAHATPPAHAAPRSPVEIVVDGTDGAGKTSFVHYLLDHCRWRGLRAASFAPYREREVYPLWAEDPERAAQIITELLAHHRATATDLDVLLWDRAWPTAYITTEHPRARAAFLPLPPVTVLLLGTPEMTRAKARAHGARGAWVLDEALIQRYHAAYHALQPPSSHRLLRALPDPAGRFDFPALARQLDPELDAAHQLRHKS
jgi:hypothetical protein